MMNAAQIACLSLENQELGPGLADFSTTYTLVSSNTAYGSILTQVYYLSDNGGQCDSFVGSGYKMPRDVCYTAFSLMLDRRPNLHILVWYTRFGESYEPRHDLSQQ